MTEKRFKKVIEGNFVLFYDGDEQIPFDEVVGVLNSLNDENEDLKQSLSSTVRELRYGVKKVQKLAKENEQLKQTIQDMRIRFKRKYDYEFDDIVDELD